MKVKAKVSFCGNFNMIEGEIKECSNKATLQDLLKAGYVEVVEDKEETEDEEVKKSKKTTKKVVKEDESK